MENGFNSLHELNFCPQLYKEGKKDAKHNKKPLLLWAYCNRILSNYEVSDVFYGLTYEVKREQIPIKSKA